VEPSRWTLELWTREGQLIGDLSGRAKDRRIIQSRNEAEEITWVQDLGEFERYAELLGYGDPRQLIAVGITEVRVRRGRTYLCGGQVVYRNPRITKDAQLLEVRAQGFLNLLMDRHTGESRSFTAANPPAMLQTLVNESQAQGPEWNFGITIGNVPTIGTHDKTYKAQELKEAIKYGNEQYNFDHQFTHDKVLNFYAPLGSNRPEIVFEYPGNILEIPQSPEDATQLGNYITVRGSGSGTEGNVKVIVQDTAAQNDYKVRQRQVSFSEVEEIAALTRHGNVELEARARPYEVPQLVVDGNVPPFVTDYGIGDYVQCTFGRYKILHSLTGMFRVERREIAIDENDKETVTLYVSK
jgi:hypothetical protein